MLIIVRLSHGPSAGIYIAEGKSNAESRHWPFFYVSLWFEFVRWEFQKIGTSPDLWIPGGEAS